MDGDKNILRMREQSGSISDNRPLVAFLYLLMRDHLPPGEIEQIVISIMNKNEMSDDKLSFSFTNGWLAKYSQDIAERLIMGTLTRPTEILGR